MCGKLPYATWRHAAHDARELRRKNDGTHYAPYWCRTCLAYHVGDSALKAVGRSARTRREEQASRYE